MRPRPRRPHLSLYVISDQGAVVTRYDERMLSNTKVSHMYTPGSAAQALAAANSYWVSYAGTAQDAPNAPSGIINPNGDWLSRCRPEPVSATTTADLNLIAENHARPWRRVARSGLYAQYQAPDDPRSLDRAHL
jgi:predicted amidohydrolase